MHPGCKEIRKQGLFLDYYAKFFSSKEADGLFESLEKEVNYFSGDLARVRVFGKFHDIPRKQAAYGDEGLKYKYSGVTVPAMEWTETLLLIRDRVNDCLGEKYNFVLINRYKDGKDYMGEHRDDESELDKSAGIASVSLGAVRDFVLRHRDTRSKCVLSKAQSPPPVSLPLGHGSLLVMKPPTNVYWYHSLPRRVSVKRPRINLTFRKIKS